MKNFSLSTYIFIILTLCIGCGNPSTPSPQSTGRSQPKGSSTPSKEETPTPKKEEKPIVKKPEEEKVYKAADVTKDFSEDRKAALKKYGAKSTRVKMTVEGVVKSIEIDKDGDLNVHLVGHNDKVVIACNTFVNNESAKEKFKKIKAGQTIKVSGTLLSEAISNMFVLGYSKLVE